MNGLMWLAFFTICVPMCSAANNVHSHKNLGFKTKMVYHKADDDSNSQAANIASQSALFKSPPQHQFSPWTSSDDLNKNKPGGFVYLTDEPSQQTSPQISTTEVPTTVKTEPTTTATISSTKAITATVNESANATTTATISSTKAITATVNESANAASEPLKFLTLTKEVIVTNETVNETERIAWLDRLAPKIDRMPVDDAGKEPQPAKAGFVSAMKMYIVGGVETSIKNFPWQAGIAVDGFGFCGGSLITKSCVLTAAHCVDSFVTFLIYLGGSRFPPSFDTKIRVPASQKIAHPDWNAGDMSNDIAILVLARTLTKEETSGPFVSIVRLPSISMASLTLENERANITGWGLDSTGGSMTPMLNYINITIVSTIVCAEAYGEDMVSSSTLCCVAPAHKATCQGDSGGPLVVREEDKKFTQAGIVSFGPSICGQGPLGFTRVSSYLGWISDNAKIVLRP